MKLADLKYMAGFLDGEGCFSVTDGSHRVQVTNTHLPSLNNLKEKFGGTVRKRSDADEKRRAAYEWYVYGESAARCAKAVLPHLREKQAQAALMINHRYETRPEVRSILKDMINTLKRV